MKLRFFGTGASEGFPAMFCECEHCNRARALGGKNLRSRSGCQLDERLFIDFSADSYAHTLYGGMNARKMEHLLVTHSHADHFYPYDLIGLFPPMALHTRPRILTVYGNEACQEKFDALMQGRNADARVQLRYRPLSPYTRYAIDGYWVTPLPANHSPRENCFVYAIEKDGKGLLYGHDSGMFCEDTLAALEAMRFDCIVLDCTSVHTAGALPGHMSIVENAQIRARLLRAGAIDENTICIATHFAHAYAPFHDELTASLAPYGFLPAYDGMQIMF